MTLRNDWSSILPSVNNSYMQPSVTGSFVFSELLVDKTPWLSFGKFGLSYAHTANSETTSINSDLKPESTISYEAGLEMSFLNNRFGFEATVYSSETKNLIFPIKFT